MALNDKLFLYGKLERLMMDLDDQEDLLADKVRDLMDPIWYSLSNEDREFLNSRGAVEVRVLYPVTLVVPDLFQEPSAEEIPTVEVLPEKGVGKRFSEDDILCLA